MKWILLLACLIGIDDPHESKIYLSKILKEPFLGATVVDLYVSPGAGKYEYELELREKNDDSVLKYKSKFVNIVLEKTQDPNVFKVTKAFQRRRGVDKPFEIKGGLKLVIHDDKVELIRPERTLILDRAILPKEGITLESEKVENK